MFFYRFTIHFAYGRLWYILSNAFVSLWARSELWPFFLSDEFPLNFFLQRGQLAHQKYEMKQTCFSLKTKAHLLTVISKRKKFVCCKNAHENSLGVTGECYAQYKMRSVIRGESPWKTMARKRSSGIVTNSNNWFWNFPLWNKYRLWSSYFFYNHSIKAFAFVLDWPKLGWIVRRKRRRRILMTRYNFVYILML